MRGVCRRFKPGVFRPVSCFHSLRYVDLGRLVSVLGGENDSMGHFYRPFTKFMISAGTPLPQGFQPLSSGIIRDVPACDRRSPNPFASELANIFPAHLQAPSGRLQSASHASKYPLCPGRLGRGRHMDGLRRPSPKFWRLRSSHSRAGHLPQHPGRRCQHHG